MVHPCETTAHIGGIENMVSRKPPKSKKGDVPPDIEENKDVPLDMEQGSLEINNEENMTSNDAKIPIFPLSPNIEIERYDHVET